MAFLSGAAIPLSVMPEGLQRVATLLPATYVVDLFRGAIQNRLDLSSAIAPAGVLIATGLIGFACNALPFRWESSARLDRRGLALVGAGLGAVYLAAFVLPLHRGLKQPMYRPASTLFVATAEPATLSVFTGATVWDGTGRILSPVASPCWATASYPLPPMTTRHHQSTQRWSIFPVST